jgi:hypothetical protein
MYRTIKTTDHKQPAPPYGMCVYITLITHTKKKGEEASYRSMVYLINTETLQKYVGFVGQTKTIIEIPDDNLFDINNTSGSESSVQQQSNFDGNEQGSSMCALRSNNSSR